MARERFQLPKGSLSKLSCIYILSNGIIKCFLEYILVTRVTEFCFSSNRNMVDALKRRINMDIL